MHHLVYFSILNSKKINSLEMHYKITNFTIIKLNKNDLRHDGEINQNLVVFCKK